MKKILLLIVVIVGCLYSHASDTLRVTKVFQIEIDSVYNIYIDSIGTTSGDVEFCFQTTTDKLIKTNIKGTVLNTTDNPYKYFTFWKGDTIILQDFSILYVNGDTIANVTRYTESDKFRLISASSDGIFVYCGGDIDVTSVAWSWHVQNVLADNDNKIVFYTTPLNGMCLYNNILYCIDYMNIYSQGTIKSKSVTNINDGNRIKGVLPLHQPVGIAGYGGHLYVFSNADKGLYRIESSNNTTVIGLSHIDILEKVYYNLSGLKTDTPSGLTIVVTRYSDGTVRTEKRMF